jgi:hypothetical protein
MDGQWGEERFYITNMSPEKFANWQTDLEKNPQIKVVLVSGKESTTEANFFEIVATKLDFSSFFGKNWDAFWDSLNDIYWEKGTGYLLMFNEAENLLIESSDDGLTILIDILKRAFNEREIEEDEQDSIGSPDDFKVIFQVIPQGSRLINALADTGNSYLLLEEPES